MAQLDLFDASQTPSGRAVAEACDELPKLAREMVAVMGHEATMKLIHEMGGRRLIVPGWPLKRTSSRFDYLEELIGPEAAQAFAERWGGIEVQVPKADKALRLVRDREIVAAYSSGATKVPELARLHNLTEGQVWRVLKRAINPP